MSDQQSVRSAVGAVRDPELHTPLEKLDAVLDVEVSSEGAAAVRVAMLVVDSPLRSVLQEAVAAAATAVEGIVRAEVEVEDMPADRRAAVINRIKGGGGIRVGGPDSPTRVISVSSGKGGVGKSSVTANTGVALAEAGYAVGIVDADVWGFSIPKMLGAEEQPRVVEEALLPSQAHGVRVISMDYFVPPDQAVIWRGPMLHKALEQFLSDVLWGEPDFLLIDLPPGTGDVAISLSQFLPRAQAVIVTTPQPTAQRVAKRAALMAEKVNQEVMGVVENMSWFTGDDGTRYEIFGAGGGQALADELGVPLLGRVPLVPELRSGADEGLPIAAAAPESEAAEAFRAIATAVVQRRPKVRTHPELVIR